MKVTHTAELLDVENGSAVGLTLTRDADGYGHIFGMEKLEIGIMDPADASRELLLMVTVNARQLFDFLEGSGMT